MKIILDQIGRRFNREWIFRNINYEFISGQSYAILGANGAGKSTLLQLISGNLTSSEGTIQYLMGDITLDQDEVFIHQSMATPYLELIEEFSLSELIDFHFRFKKYRFGFDKKGIIELLGFKNAESKAIKHFSSGMKQRVKLALAFCSDAELLLLDEPTSNLDQQGLEWYLQLVASQFKERLVIICSNQEQEYSFCDHCINLSDYK